MKKTIFASLCLLLFSHPLLASPKAKSFMEANSLSIGIDDKDNSNSEITRSSFLQIIERVSNIYSPIIAERGARLIVAKSWIDPTVNAFAEQDGKKWKVTFYGGLARHKFMTEDAFLMVVCHEIGHHIGGAPQYVSHDWPSSIEGQADYWAALKCFRKVTENDDNISLVLGKAIDPKALESCINIWGQDLKAKAVCERTAIASLALGELLADLGKENAVSFQTPDPTVVSTTLEEHPKAQCRLDTLLAGALCNKKASEDVSNQNPNIGACIEHGILEGARPACWYKQAI